MCAAQLAVTMKMCILWFYQMSSAQEAMGADFSQINQIKY